MELRRSIFAASSALSLSMGIAPGIAAAQTATATLQSGSAEEAAPIDDIVVTANKRSESLSRVGLSVVAVSGDTLRERGVVSLEDVAALVPGLSFAPSANATPILTLRGIGFNESSLGVRGGRVGLHRDWQRLSGLSAGLLDLPIPGVM